MKKLLLFLSFALVALAQQGQLASSFTASGSAGGGFVQVANQSLAPSTPTSAGRFYFDSTNRLAWKNSGGFIGVIDINGASRVLTLTGNPTLADWFDQSVKVAASPTFASLSTGSGVITGGAFTGTRFLANADPLDGTFAATFVGSSNNGLTLKDSANQSGVQFANFKKSDGTTIGSISRVTTTDAVAYNTTSDGRLKTNVRDFTGADSGRIIDGLRPRWFDWKASELMEPVEVVTDGVKRTELQPVKDKGRTDKHASDSRSIVGFIAQEEASVDPVLVRIGAVTVGDGDPDRITKQWARSDAALVPVLVAEIKALRARVAALEKK